MSITNRMGIGKPKLAHPSTGPKSTGRKKYPCNCMGGKSSWCPARRELSREYKRLSDNRRHRDRARLRRAAPINLDIRLVLAFQSQCEYCGTRGDCNGIPSKHVTNSYTDFWTADRIVPGARGGTYEVANVTLACSKCNSLKATKDYIGPVRSLAVMEARCE